MPVRRPGLARLFSSLLYEGLVVFGILLVGFLIPQIILAAFLQGTPGRLLWVHLVMMLLLYFVWFWLNGGQTLAMKTWKLRIVDADGRALRPLQAVLRYLAAWLSVVLLGAGFLCALFDRDRRFLHDRIAGTRIVFESPD
ncbi:MAG: RDD family protein [Azonexus sp.]|jgi:uncharacterized RDD family membrane protein YckC|nr:RDD family protein [Betaproteobacteria bacterium]MBK8917284.1 RDD family protein [Betaproteobacteria bacterium]MBP6035047.1 RDD family protein [Azonexus sp.]MBP6905975.1 RDD family protein [Azonexus sp.]